MKPPVSVHDNKHQTPTAKEAGTVRGLIFFFAIIIFLIPHQALAYTFPERPAVTYERFNPVETAILTTDEPAAGFLASIKEQYPSLTVTAVYNTLFHGFAVRGKRSVIKELETEIKPKAIAPAAGYRVSNENISFIGADEVHRLFDRSGRRLTGKGVKVGVIDTGIDYRHPDLSINYSGGFDLIDNDSDPMETRAPKEFATIHGTHVAGIIAANGKLEGMAPDAEIYAYRALGPGGMGSSDQVIAAIEKAVEDNVDVLNLSLGNTVNGPDWPTSLALDKAVEHGVVAVTSSGNSGPERWTVGSPGTSAKAISVGASVPPLSVPYLTVPLRDREIPLTLLRGSGSWLKAREEVIVYGGIGRPEELADAEGKIALVKRGVLPFTEKVKNAEKAGAIAVLIFNHEKGVFNGQLEESVSIPAASLSKKEGEWLKKTIAKAGTVKTGYRQVQDRLAPFSSRGPVTHTWQVKPDMLAPGVEINSTIPHGYRALDGTSMAAPHVAGAAALIKQAHPDWTPEQVKASMMNTAVLIKDRGGNRYLPDQQGAGRIRTDLAVEADTLVYPSSFSFNLAKKTRYRTEQKVDVTIENTGEKARTYYFNTPEEANGIQWKLPYPVTVPAGARKQVEIAVDVQPGHMKKGVHQDYLEIEASGTDKITLPYLFVVGEPDYPRIMGFEWKQDEKTGNNRYEVYLPGGADQFGIALYDPDTFHFIQYLDYRENVERGMSAFMPDITGLEPGKEYKALVFAKKAGRENTIETIFASY